MDTDVTLAGETAVLQIDQKALIAEVQSAEQRTGNIGYPEFMLGDVVVGEGNGKNTTSISTDSHTVGG